MKSIFTFVHGAGNEQAIESRNMQFGVEMSLAHTCKSCMKNILYIKKLEAS